jgi:hypothetical protein
MTFEIEFDTKDYSSRGIWSKINKAPIPSNIIGKLKPDYFSFLKYCRLFIKVPND